MTDEYHLTPRQKDVLAAVVKEGGYEAAARSLGLNIQTVKNHLTMIHDATGSTTTLQTLWKLGYLHLPGDPLGVDQTELRRARRSLLETRAALEAAIAAIEARIH